MSLATIDRDGAFSPYPDVDRWLMPLGEPGLHLEIDGTREEIAQHEVVAFAGESSVSAIGIEQPGRNLNLMVSRDFGQASLVRVSVAQALAIRSEPNELSVVMNLGSSLSISGAALDLYDAALLEMGESVVLESPDGCAAVARIRPFQRPTRSTIRLSH